MGFFAGTLEETGSRWLQRIHRENQAIEVRHAVTVVEEVIEEVEGQGSEFLIFLFFFSSFIAVNGGTCQGVVYIITFCALHSGDRMWPSKFLAEFSPVLVASHFVFTGMN